MRLKNLTMVLVAACLCGCSPLGVIPPLSEKTSHHDSKALMAFYNGQQVVHPDASKKLDGLFQEKLDSSCRPVPPAAAAPAGAAVVPLLAAVAELGFNLFIEERRRQINEIVEASKATYAVSTVVDASLLAQAQCVLVIRYHVDENSKGPVADMVALLRLIPSVGAGGADNGSFRIQPAYLKMLNTVAWTRAIGPDQDKASVSFAISIKAVARERSELARLLPVSEGAASVPSVVLGDAIRCQDDNCERSDLLIYPRTRGPLSFTLAAAEHGVTGFNDKVELAKLDAIKAALGPAIGEAVKAHFGD
jgi:hypothetical protein